MYSERERETGREGGRERQGGKEGERDRGRGKEGHTRERERQGGKEGERDRGRGKEGERDREGRRKRETEGEGRREREREGEGRRPTKLSNLALQLILHPREGQRQSHPVLSLLLQNLLLFFDQLLVPGLQLCHLLMEVGLLRFLAVLRRAGVTEVGVRVGVMRSVLWGGREGESLRAQGAFILILILRSPSQES